MQVAVAAALGFGCVASARAQQPDPAVAATPAAQPAVPAEVSRLLVEAQKLQVRNRYFDALLKLDEAEKLAPDLPDIYNVRGSIYLTEVLRDFDKARAFFEKARDLAPGALPPRFNLAELDYVKQDYAKAEAAFQQLVVDFPQVPLAVRHLIQIKILVCQLKQGRRGEAEKTLKDHFTFMDDTPAYYFAKAAFAFDSGDEKSGLDWVARAGAIFKQQENDPFRDALHEAKWLGSVTTAPK